MLGEILGRRRDQVVLATKFGGRGPDMGYGPAAGAKGSRAYIRRAVAESLRRLRTDHIDLYQIHNPDPKTPVEETIAALHELVAEGKVRYLGHSNFSGWQLADAAHLAAGRGHTAVHLRPEPVVTAPAPGGGGPRARGQALRRRRAAVFAAGQRAAHRQDPARPAGPGGNRLASGASYYEGYVTDDRLDKVEALIAWAQEHGVTALDVAIGALAAQPGCSSVIAGAMTPEQVKANAAASDWIPAAAELAEIDQIVSAPGHRRLTAGLLAFTRRATRRQIWPHARSGSHCSSWLALSLSVPSAWVRP